MKASEIREAYLAYFESRGHKRLPSSSLIPLDDPTLLFTNAGMNQFKDVFLGQRKVDYKRATTSQKCIRAGGKHNDLENVGETARHHTFFEMLGNFSFGDYFKEDAIKFAWDFVRKELGLSPDRLYATVYKDDDEAFALWERIAPELANGRVMRFGEKDNFWSMGETGPCGPCSELHFDRGEEFSCGKPTCTVNCDCDRYMEFWNLVFMQYDRDAAGKLTPLPKPSVDTGGGLERMTMLMQRVNSNYDTDVFSPLLNAIVELTGKEYHQDKRGLSHRVVADHVRALTFAIADGGIPSNEGRGYVLRRILRRGARHGRLLGKHDPFIYKLTSVLVDQMGHQFPEVKSQAEHVALVIRSEEESFGETLDRGIERFEGVLNRMKIFSHSIVPGDDVFELYDTYGFPPDLTAAMAKERGLTIDLQGFEESLERQRQKSRAVSSFAVVFEGKYPDSKFVGYDDRFEIKTSLEFIDMHNKQLQIVLRETPFYGESGGQVGDVGTLISTDVKLDIFDTKRNGDSIIHLAANPSAKPSFQVGMPIIARVDGTRQKHIQRNHTATHLLHKALRTVLGEHVQQKGSLVAPDRLRFDFSHFKALSEDEIKEIERQVNEEILNNRKVKWGIFDINEAKAQGAMALFGEKYGDRVRMVEVEGYSKELCGGTHVQATGEIGLFVITTETAIAAGIRRIEAFTGAGAFDYLRSVKSQLEATARVLKQPEDKIVTRVEELLEESKKLKKELEKTQAESASGEIEGLFASKAFEVKGVKLLVHTFEGKDQLNTYADYTKSLSYPAAGVFYNPSGQYAITASDTAIKKGLQPREIIKDVNAALGGRGGGREYFVQGASTLTLDEAKIRATILPLIEKAIA